VVRTIVDGYNLLFRDLDDSPGASLRDRREALLRRLDAVRTPGAEIVVVFDGKPGRGPREPRPDGLRVLWAASPRSADDLIVSLVEKAPRHGTLVITADRELRSRVRSAGGRVGSPDVHLRPPKRRGSSPPSSRAAKPPPPTGAELDAWERLFEEGREGERE
jgi:predicted RNA-binding protein with PIN domain